MKPGILTTEFWLTAAVLVLTNVEVLPVPEKYRWILTLGGLVGYAISRGLAKATGTEPILGIPIGSSIPPDPADLQKAEETSQAAISQNAELVAKPKRKAPRRAAK